MKPSSLSSPSSSLASTMSPLPAAYSSTMHGVKDLALLSHLILLNTDYSSSLGHWEPTSKSPFVNMPLIYQSVPFYLLPFLSQSQHETAQSYLGTEGLCPSLHKIPCYMRNGIMPKLPKGNTFLPSFCKCDSTYYSFRHIWWHR